MATPETNHYRPFDEILPELKVNNGIEDGETGLQTKVEEIQYGAVLGKPGSHNRRAAVIKPPLNGELREENPEGVEIIWIASIAPYQDRPVYKNLKIIKKAA